MSDLQTIVADRKARVITEVADLLAKGVPLSFALSTVQGIEHSATLGEDLDYDYGPCLDVARVWERRNARAEAITNAADTLEDAAKVIDGLLAYLGPTRATVRHADRLRADLTAAFCVNTAKQLRAVGEDLP